MARGLLIEVMWPRGHSPESERVRTVKKPDAVFENRRLVLALGMWAVALFTLLSLAFGASVFGCVGDAVEVVLGGSLGVVGWLIPAMFVLGGVAVVRRRSFTAFRVFVDTVLIVIAAVLAHLVSDGSGGVIGEWVGDAAQVSFGVVGAFVVAIMLAVIGIAARIDVRPFAKRALGAVESWRASSMPEVFDESDETIVEESPAIRNSASGRRSRRRRRVKRPGTIVPMRRRPFGAIRPAFGKRPTRLLSERSSARRAWSRRSRFRARTCSCVASRRMLVRWMSSFTRRVIFSSPRWVRTTWT